MYVLTSSNLVSSMGDTGCPLGSALGGKMGGFMSCPGPGCPGFHGEDISHGMMVLAGENTTTTVHHYTNIQQHT